MCKRNLQHSRAGALEAWRMGKASRVVPALPSCRCTLYDTAHALLLEVIAAISFSLRSPPPRGFMTSLRPLPSARVNKYQVLLRPTSVLPRSLWPHQEFLPPGHLPESHDPISRSARARRPALPPLAASRISHLAIAVDPIYLPGSAKVSSNRARSSGAASRCHYSLSFSSTRQTASTGAQFCIQMSASHRDQGLHNSDASGTA